MKDKLPKAKDLYKFLGPPIIEGFSKFFSEGGIFLDGVDLTFNAVKVQEDLKGNALKNFSLIMEIIVEKPLSDHLFIVFSAEVTAYLDEIISQEKGSFSSKERRLGCRK